MNEQNTPRFTTQITFGNILTIGLGCLAFAAMFFALDSRSQANADFIAELRVDMKAHASRLSNIEREQARTGERYESIQTLLAQIDKRLERIETQQ